MDEWWRDSYPPHPTPLIDYLLDDYDYRQLGSGAYGMVVSALDTQTGKRLAIKKCANLFVDPLDARKIGREIRIMSQLNHPNIIKVGGLGRGCPSKEGRKEGRSLGPRYVGGGSGKRVHHGCPALQMTEAMARKPPTNQPMHHHHHHNDNDNRSWTCCPRPPPTLTTSTWCV